MALAGSAPLVAISIPSLPQVPAATPASAPPPGAPRGTLRARCVAFGSLAAFILAVVLIVATTEGSPAPSAAPRSRPVAARYWTVRPGQTLSSIAARESVDLAALVQLNPRLIPSSLASGARVRLPG